ncbi:hypothetical protein ACFQPG_11490 [Sphingomonas sp. GCM10030256]|uniref:hypothetical protein n=1 Tax=Sphingomonas sp. GCM10030256 TaxID=3273427 RepID=UPI003622B3A0
MKWTDLIVPGAAALMLGACESRGGVAPAENGDAQVSRSTADPAVMASGEQSVSNQQTAAPQPSTGTPGTPTKQPAPIDPKTVQPSPIQVPAEVDPPHVDPGDKVPE